MLDNRVSLRYNEVRGRTEIHWLSQGPVLILVSIHTGQFSIALHDSPCVHYNICVLLPSETKTKTI